MAIYEIHGTKVKVDIYQVLPEHAGPCEGKAVKLLRALPADRFLASLDASDAKLHSAAHNSVLAEIEDQFFAARRDMMPVVSFSRA